MFACDSVVFSIVNNYLYSTQPLKGCHACMSVACEHVWWKKNKQKKNTEKKYIFRFERL